VTPPGAVAAAGPPEFTAASLSEYMRVVEDRMLASEKPLWYRGLRNSEYSLVPSLYRHPGFGAMDASQRVALERRILSQFRNRSLPFDARTRQNDWDYEFLMQHSGVPTRLLDWTENPMIGLYFAVEKVDHPGDDAAVWILTPTQWNREALSASSYNEGILSLEEAGIRGYAPSADHDRMNNHPVAIYGIHNSARIVAQRGVFTVFGQSAEGMQDIAWSTLPTSPLVRVVIPAARRAEMLSQLVGMGVTESTIFPDLDGLARELRREFGFF
jgi:hypothetical protein